MIATAASAVVRVRPRRSLVRNGTLSVIVAVLTLSIAVAVIALNGGRWGALLVVDLLVVVAGVAAGLRSGWVFTRIDADGISGNGFIAPVLHVPMASIAAVHLIPTWTHSGEIVTQLLVTDAEGRRLFRRRGNYWDADALERIAAALPVPVIRRSEPMSIKAFWRTYPRSVYWFEDSTAVRALLGIGTILLGVGLAIAALAMMR